MPLGAIWDLFPEFNGIVVNFSASFMTLQSLCPTVSSMHLRPEQIKTCNAKNSSLVTIQVILTLSLLTSFSSSSLIKNAFKKRKSYP